MGLVSAEVLSVVMLLVDAMEALVFLWLVAAEAAEAEPVEQEHQEQS